MAAMAYSWFSALTTPFGGYASDTEPRKEFDPTWLARRYKITSEMALTLAKVLSYWMNHIDTLPFDDTRKLRLRTCTMRFSNWQKFSFTAKDGSQKQWSRTLRRCEVSRICPWCRQYALMSVYTGLARLIGKKTPVYVLEREEDLADRKRIFRAPENTVAALRNVIYPSTLNEPRLGAAFFLRGRAPRAATLCDVDYLKDVLARMLDWDLAKIIHTGRLEDHLEVMGDLRMWSTSPEVKLLGNTDG